MPVLDQGIRHVTRFMAEDLLRRLQRAPQEILVSCLLFKAIRTISDRVCSGRQVARGPEFLVLGALYPVLREPETKDFCNAEQLPCVLKKFGVEK